jgi:hypothetical protein
LAISRAAAYLKHANALVVARVHGIAAFQNASDESKEQIAAMMS